MRTNMQGWTQRQTDRGGNREVRDRERDESRKTGKEMRAREAEIKTERINPNWSLRDYKLIH
jgi:hypothetical protein